MSDAKVTFSDLDYEPTADPGRIVRFNFACPRHKGRRCEGLIIKGKTLLKHDPQGKNGGVAQWDWDGNMVAPTFKPSVNCGGCWHGFITKGRCVENNVDVPEPLNA
jgi:hypothetical protein